MKHLLSDTRTVVHISTHKPGYTDKRTSVCMESINVHLLSPTYVECSVLS